MFADFTGESFYASFRLIRQPLRAGNVFFEALGIDGGFFFQSQQSDIDSQQSLANFILQIATDLFSFVFLRRQNLMGQMPQMFLQAA